MDTSEFYQKYNIDRDLFEIKLEAVSGELVGLVTFLRQPTGTQCVLPVADAWELIIKRASSPEEAVVLSALIHQNLDGIQVAALMYKAEEIIKDSVAYASPSEEQESILLSAGSMIRRFGNPDYLDPNSCKIILMHEKVVAHRAGLMPASGDA